MTPQRNAILKEIKKLNSHPTAEEVYIKIRERLPSISLGTVYRNLDILTARGLIKKLEPGRPLMRFDGNIREHYHITCRHCGMIEDAPIEPSDTYLENIENAVGNITKYGIFGHKLEFVGLCPKCMEQENKNTGKEEKNILGKEVSENGFEG